ncbi:MAG: sugar phosphate isomerase/epimerase family protein [Actinocatenispora sp.]
MTRHWRLADTDWNHWPDGLSDERLWPTVAADGLAGIEIGVYSATEELSPDRMQLRSTLAAAHRLPVLAMLLSLPKGRWPGGALTHDLAQVTRQVVGCTKACRRLGLSTLGVWPGADLPGASWDAFVAGVRQIRDVADTAGVRIALEYKPGTLLPDAEAAVALMEEAPGTGVLLDVGHSYAAGEDPAAVVRQLNDRLWHVHLGDATTGAADDDLPLGQVHDAGPVITALDEIGFTGVAAFDLYGAACSEQWTGHGAVRESLNHIEGSLRHIRSNS